MESLTYFILSLFILVVLFGGIAYILSVLYLVIGILSRPKCPNCAKAIGKKTIRCPHCGNPLGERQPQEEINPELYTRVKAFVAEETRISPKKLTKLTPDTDLSEGLGIAGDDGYDLLEAFCEAFEIENMSEIDPYEYFGPEACNPFYVYVLLYHWVFDREKLSDFVGQTPLTLRDLVKSAEAKRWIPPEATS